MTCSRRTTVVFSSFTSPWRRVTDDRVEPLFITTLLLPPLSSITLVLFAILRPAMDPSLKQAVSGYDNTNHLRLKLFLHATVKQRIFHILQSTTVSYTDA